MLEIFNLLSDGKGWARPQSGIQVFAVYPKWVTGISVWTWSLGPMLVPMNRAGRGGVGGEAGHKLGHSVWGVGSSDKLFTVLSKSFLKCPSRIDRGFLSRVYKTVFRNQ